MDAVHFNTRVHGSDPTVQINMRELYDDRYNEQNEYVCLSLSRRSVGGRSDCDLLCMDEHGAVLEEVS